MKLNHFQKREDVTRVWPSLAHEFDPETNVNRNVFSLMPHHNASGILLNRDVRMNVATYRDGILQNGGVPRWQQGLLFRLTELESARAVMHRTDARLVEAVRPSDRAFKGHVIHDEYAVAVQGIVHPNQEGWVAISAPELDFKMNHNEPLRTVADLKCLIGQLTSAQAEKQNAIYSQWGYFRVNGVQMI